MSSQNNELIHPSKKFAIPHHFVPFKQSSIGRPVGRILIFLDASQTAEWLEDGGIMPDNRKADIAEMHFLAYTSSPQ